MRTILVVNGEKYWQEHLPQYRVVQKRIQDSYWILREGKLWAIDAQGGVAIDGVLWRLGALRPHKNHRTALELIRLSQIPCVNSVNTLLRGYDRLSMLYELRELQIPTIEFDVVLGEEMLRRIRPQFPCVVKVGNYHGGFGKALIKDEQQWSDIVDMTFPIDDYISVENFIDYKRDIRCLAIGEKMWAMERKGVFWKANVQTQKHQVIEPPQQLREYTQKTMHHLQADILGIDFLQTQDDEYIALECNDIPGLEGFSQEVQKELATVLHNKMTGYMVGL